MINKVHCADCGFLGIREHGSGKVLEATEQARRRCMVSTGGSGGTIIPVFLCYRDAIRFSADELSTVQSIHDLRHTRAAFSF